MLSNKDRKSLSEFFFLRGMAAFFLHPRYSGPNWNKMCHIFKITTEVLKITEIGKRSTIFTYFTLIYFSYTRTYLGTCTYHIRAIAMAIVCSVCLVYILRDTQSYTTFESLVHNIYARTPTYIQQPLKFGLSICLSNRNNRSFYVKTSRGK